MSDQQKAALTRRAITLGILVACLAPIAAVSAPADVGQCAGSDNALRIVVSDVRSSAGDVRVDVCSASDFLKACQFGAAAPARRGETVVVVPDLPPGEYAVQAYHDGNDNHQVDRNILGIPTEGVGFSNDPPLRFRAPSFKAAAFNFDGGGKTIVLRLRHFVP
jgi:uncharacterized protein (DUF2141 family)